MFVKNGEKIIEKLPFEPFKPIVYETIRTYNKKPFLLEEHLSRLKISASYVNLKIPFGIREIETVLFDLCKTYEGECYFKIYIEGKDYYIEVQELSFEEATVEIGFSKIRKAPNDVIPSQLKINNRSDILLARLHKGNFYDVVMLNTHGYVAECSFSNLFIVKENRLITPSIDSDILAGITRSIILELSKDIGIHYEERHVQPWELFKADELFLTHTSRGVVKVAKLERKEFNDFRIINLIKDKYENFAVRNC